MASFLQQIVAKQNLAAIRHKSYFIQENQSKGTKSWQASTDRVNFIEINGFTLNEKLRDLWNKDHAQFEPQATFKDEKLQLSYR